MPSSSQSTRGRPYRSPRRDAAARATRRAILDAAEELFATTGYAATTREAIAAGAGVAVQTVAAVFGTKRAILDALLDEATRGDGAPSPAMRSWLQDLRDQPDAAAMLRHHAASSARLSARLARLAEVVRRAAAADPEIAAVWEDFQQQRRRGQATVVELLAGRGPLHPSLARDEAADVLWTLTDDALYHALVVERGWRQPRFEAWLASTMALLLLGD